VPPPPGDRVSFTREGDTAGTITYRIGPSGDGTTDQGTAQALEWLLAPLPSHEQAQHLQAELLQAWKGKNRRVTYHFKMYDASRRSLAQGHGSGLSGGFSLRARRGEPQDAAEVLRRTQQLAVEVLEHIEDQLARRKKDVVEGMRDMRNDEVQLGAVQEQLDQVARFEEQTALGGAAAARKGRPARGKTAKDKKRSSETGRARESYQADLERVLNHMRIAMTNSASKDPTLRRLHAIDIGVRRILGVIETALEGGPNAAHAGLVVVLADDSLSAFFRMQADLVLHHATRVRQHMLARDHVLEQLLQAARADPVLDAVRSTLRAHVADTRNTPLVSSRMLKAQQVRAFGLFATRSCNTAGAAVPAHTPPGFVHSPPTTHTGTPTLTHMHTRRTR